MQIKTLLVTLLLVGILLFLSGCTSNNTNKKSNNGSDESNWLENYIPIHAVGTGSDDFWIEFPAGSDSYGQSIEHFDWVTDTIDNNCVLFVVHRTGCVGCKEQGDLVISLAKKYNKDVEFHDIDAVSDATAEIQQMSNEAYLYDPNGASGYIALTGVFTYIEENETVEFTVEVENGTGDNYVILDFGDGVIYSDYMCWSHTVSHTYTAVGTYYPDIEIHDLHSNCYDHYHDYASVIVCESNPSGY